MVSIDHFLFYGAFGTPHQYSHYYYQLFLLKLHHFFNRRRLGLARALDFIPDCIQNCSAAYNKELASLRALVTLSALRTSLRMQRIQYMLSSSHPWLTAFLPLRL